MTTPRTVFKIDEDIPGSDLAAETAAASIVFKREDPAYSALLLKHAKELFDFANDYQGKYSDSIPQVQQFYSSSGFQDELMWSAAWLYRATGATKYRDFISDMDAGGTRTMFSWDDKYVGAQILIAKWVLEGKAPNDADWDKHKDQAEEFLCNCLQMGHGNIVKTKGGLLWFNEWDNLQYTISATFALTVYADYLSASRKSMDCVEAADSIHPSTLIAAARSQVDYILGRNPKNTSYMVGIGPNFPQKIHHRGSSIVSYKKDPTPVGCEEGFKDWFYKDQPNPNVLLGAVVGGPDNNDNFIDDRQQFKSAESGTANSAGIVGVLARLSAI